MFKLTESQRQFAYAMTKDIIDECCLRSKGSTFTKTIRTRLGVADHISNLCAGFAHVRVESAATDSSIVHTWTLTICVKQ